MAKRILTVIADVSTGGRVVLSGGELEDEVGCCRISCECSNENVAQDCRLYCGREVCVDLSGSTITRVG
jgi:hypothetical protein